MEKKFILQQGCVDILIDKVVPCLEEVATGDIKETAVFKIESRAFLRTFNEANGWRIDWFDIPRDVEVYALVLKDTNAIQGLVGIRNDKDAKAAYIHWACAAPHNNKHDFGKREFIGVGGHLFAIAVDKSLQWGYGGTVYGFAATQELVLHYVKTLNAEYIGLLHDYHFVIDGQNATALLEVYDYEWNKS